MGGGMAVTQIASQVGGGAAWWARRWPQ